MISASSSTTLFEYDAHKLSYFDPAGLSSCCVYIDVHRSTNFIHFARLIVIQQIAKTSENKLLSFCRNLTHLELKPMHSIRAPMTARDGHKIEPERKKPTSSICMP